MFIAKIIRLISAIGSTTENSSQKLGILKTLWFKVYDTTRMELIIRQITLPKLHELIVDAIMRIFQNLGC